MLVVAEDGVVQRGNDMVEVTEVMMVEEEEEQVYGDTPLPEPLLVTHRLVLLQVRKHVAKILE